MSDNFTSAFCGRSPGARAAQERKQRFIDAVLADPTVPSSEAAAQVGIGDTSAHRYRAEIIAEHGEAYRPRMAKAAKRRRPSLSHDAVSRRVLASLAIDLDSYAGVGIAGLDPSKIDVTDPANLDNLASILDSLRTLTSFAKAIDKQRKATPTSNVIQGNFTAKGTTA